MDKKGKDGFAIAGFVLGLVAFIPYLQFVAVPGIVFSALGMRSKKRGLAIAGLVLSIVALALTFLLIILGVAFVVGTNVIGSSVSSVNVSA